MNTATLEIIKAALKNDQTLTQAECTKIIKFIKYPKKETKKDNTSPPYILRRKQAAARLGITLRTLDYWHQEGILKGVRIPGRVRSIGFRSTDIEELISSDDE